MAKFRVFIEYFHPSKQDLTAPKTAWDYMSRLIGWRHARIIILAEPVEFISGDVKGYAYDAGKDDKKGLIAMYEEFRASPLNRYLPIGDFTGKLSVDQINAYVEEYLKQNPSYNLITNNCQDLAKFMCKKVTGGLLPTTEKMRGAVYFVSGSPVENFVKIKVEVGFEDAIIYDPTASLTKGPVPKTIEEVIKEEK